jgi:cyclase
VLKKRLIGVVTVRNGWAVQSFGYKKYLPLGKPEVVVENLDRWGIDEILIQCIDRSCFHLGPDVDLLQKVGTLGLSTPLIYAGGIRDSRDAVEVVSAGADRVMVDAMLWNQPKNLESIARELGIQALITNIPVSIINDCLLWYDYRNSNEIDFRSLVMAKLNLDWVSEVMLTDWRHEGLANTFNQQIPNLFAALIKKPLLLFGGISTQEQMQSLMARESVVAVGIGNFLNYKEHAVQNLKSTSQVIHIRSEHYLNENSLV